MSTRSLRYADARHRAYLESLDELRDAVEDFNRLLPGTGLNENPLHINILLDLAFDERIKIIGPYGPLLPGIRVLFTNPIELFLTRWADDCGVRMVWDVNETNEGRYWRQENTRILWPHISFISQILFNLASNEFFFFHIMSRNALWTGA